MTPIGSAAGAAVIALAGALLPADSAWSQGRDICGLPLVSFDTLMQRLQSAGVAGPQQVENFIVFTDQPNGRTWTFTAATHPAHPAVACRSLEKQGNGFAVRTDLRCAAAKDRCDALARDFAALDQRMNEAIRKGQ